jgi:hypothetical protein
MRLMMVRLTTARDSTLRDSTDMMHPLSRWGIDMGEQFAASGERIE